MLVHALVVHDLLQNSLKCRVVVVLVSTISRRVYWPILEERKPVSSAMSLEVRLARYIIAMERPDWLDEGSLC